jgi:hypothetical protein
MSTLWVVVHIQLKAIDVVSIHLFGQQGVAIVHLNRIHVFAELFFKVGKELENLWTRFSLVAVMGSEETHIVETDRIGVLRKGKQREKQNENEDGK